MTIVTKKNLGWFLTLGFFKRYSGYVLPSLTRFHVCLNCCSQSTYSMSQIYTVCLSKSRRMLEYRKYWTLVPLPKVSIHPAQDRRISSFYFVKFHRLSFRHLHIARIYRHPLIVVNVNLHRNHSSRCDAITHPFYTNYSIIFCSFSSEHTRSLSRTHHEEASIFMSHCPSATSVIVSYDPRNLNRHPS